MIRLMFIGECIGWSYDFFSWWIENRNQIQVYILRWEEQIGG